MARPPSLSAPDPAAPAPGRGAQLLEKLGPMDLDDIRFILLDTETTGVSGAPKILEVAARGWSTHPGRIYPKPFESLVNPGEPIPPSSSAVHHLTDRKVRGAPSLAEVLPSFSAYVGDSPIVAFNSDYDQGVLAGTPLYDHVWLDAYRMVMHMWSLGDRNAHGFELTSFKQQDLRYWLDLPDIAGDAHRAGADIMLTGLLFDQIVKKYKQMGYSTRFSDFVDWVNAPILHSVIPIGSGAYRGKTPEQVETWALKKAFDPTDPMFESFKKFNIHDALRPEYARRVGLESQGKPARSRRGSFGPSR